MSEADFTLLKQLARETRDGVKRIGDRQKALEEKVTEGFANLRAHDFTHHTDMALMERRVTALEAEIERISTAQGINTDE
ncbi:MAG: hypothetical protein AAFR21_15240 [Pseudomonadota bacterium]